LWYGWSAMQQDLTEIKALAEEMRHRQAARTDPEPRADAEAHL